MTVEPNAESANKERSGQEIDHEEPVLEAVDVFAESATNFAAFSAHRGLLFLEVLDRLGHFGRRDETIAFALLALQFAELGLHLLQPGIELAELGLILLLCGGLHLAHDVERPERRALAADGNQILRAAEELDGVRREREV